MKIKRLNNQGIAHLGLIVLVFIVLIVIGLIGYRVYQANFASIFYYGTHGNEIFKRITKSTDYGFDKEITLPTNKVVALKDGDETIKFRLTNIYSGSRTEPKCPNNALCLRDDPDVKAGMEYAGMTFSGSSGPGIGGSFYLNDVEGVTNKLLPYDVEMLGSDFRRVSTVKIIKKNFIKAELGKPFTLKNGGVAALEPGKIGVNLWISICGGTATTCIDDINFYVDGESVEMSFRNIVDYRTNPELYYGSRDGSSAEHKGIRLRLLESDDKTYATFVFEKV